MLEKFLQSWPTLVAGIAVLVVTFAFVMKQITMQDYLVLFGMLTGGGLALSKTFNVSGGEKGDTGKTGSVGAVGSTGPVGPAGVDAPK